MGGRGCRGQLKCGRDIARGLLTLIATGLRLRKSRLVERALLRQRQTSDSNDFSGLSGTCHLHANLIASLLT